MTWQIISTGSVDTERLGQLLGAAISPPVLIELVSDLGGGKTTFVRGLAAGLKSKDQVSSPTFTLARIYKCAGGAEIHHFDFYRLNEPGIIAEQLAESLADTNVVTIVEWSDIVKNVLPEGRLTVELHMTPNNPDERQISLHYPESLAEQIRETQTQWEEVEP